MPSGSVTSPSYTQPSRDKFTVFLASLFHRFATLLNTVLLLEDLISHRLAAYFFPTINDPGEQAVVPLFIRHLAILEAVSVENLLFFWQGGGKTKFLMFSS